MVIVIVIVEMATMVVMCWCCVIANLKAGYSDVSAIIIAKCYTTWGCDGIPMSSIENVEVRKKIFGRFVLAAVVHGNWPLWTTVTTVAMDHGSIELQCLFIFSNALSQEPKCP